MTEIVYGKKKFNEYRSKATQSIEAITKEIQKWDSTYIPEMAYLCEQLKEIEDWVCQTGEYASEGRTA